MYPGKDPSNDMLTDDVGMSASQFGEDTSISKLMAGALLMDSGCGDLPFNWPDNFPTSHSPLVKMERNEPMSTNLDCWQLPTNHPNEYTHNYQQFSQNNGFNPVSNGSINNNSSFRQGFGSGHFKSPQNQCRQRYGNYSNEKYPDFNIALKSETNERKWSTCAMDSRNTDVFDPLRENAKNPSVKESPYSPLSFKINETSTSLTACSPNTDTEKKMFEFIESDSDSKTSAGNDSQGANRSEWPSTSSSPTLDINVDQMITSGVTVAGYKPRKLICKRKKSTVPSEQKDPGYWEKRKKNNDSARRSREAKKEKERSFYKRALELEYENHYLKERVAYLERKLESVMQQNPSFRGSDAPPAI